MKTIYKILLTIYLATLGWVAYQGFQYSLLISLGLLLPLFWLKHYLYKVEYISYVYLTQVLGTTCKLYDTPYYDKVMHSLSGIIFVVIAYIILKNYIKEKPLLMIMINCVETAVAFLWEVFEYSGLVFFNYDASRHYTTGVHDTMQDMIFSFLAGLVITYFIYKFPTFIEKLYQPEQKVIVENQENLTS